MELSAGVKPRGVGDRKSAYLRPRSGSFHSMQTSGWGRQAENRRAGWGLSSGGAPADIFAGGVAQTSRIRGPTYFVWALLAPRAQELWI
jgi:hypothetical protein